MIKNLPVNERPREKLIEQGVNFLSDAELLAILLRTGTRGKSAVVLAQELLQQFGGLRFLLQSNLEHFKRVKGVGAAAYAQIQAGLELAKRMIVSDCKQAQTIRNSTDVLPMLQQEFDDDTERFVCVFLDSKLRVIAMEQLGMGTINQADLYPRNLVARILYSDWRRSAY